MIFYSKAAKATKGEVFVLDLCGLCGLVVKFVFVFASLCRIPCVGYGYAALRSLWLLRTVMF